MVAFWNGKQITGKVPFKKCGGEVMASSLFSLFAAIQSAKLWFWVDQEMSFWQSERRHFMPGRSWTIWCSLQNWMPSATGHRKAEKEQEFYLFQVDASRWHRVDIAIQRCHFPPQWLTGWLVPTCTTTPKSCLSFSWIHRCLLGILPLSEAYQPWTTSGRWNVNQNLLLFLISYQKQPHLPFRNKRSIALKKQNKTKTFVYTYSSQRGPSSTACTGRCGTTTKACRRIRASSTTRTFSSVCLGCGSSKYATSPALSTRTWGMRCTSATACTRQPARTPPPLAPRTELRRSKTTKCGCDTLKKLRP